MGDGDDLDPNIGRLIDDGKGEATQHEASGAVWMLGTPLRGRGDASDRLLECRDEALRSAQTALGIPGDGNSGFGPGFRVYLNAVWRHAPSAEVRV